jgi:predicted Zn-dependent protease
MRRGLLLGGLAAALALGWACTDIAGPARPAPYEWRLFIPNDTGGVDSLSFHWPRASLPVRFWAEDTFNLSRHVADGIARWKTAFLYGEYDGVLVPDSSSADVIVRAGLPPKNGLAPPERFDALLPECEGATVFDTVATRHELGLPMRIYINQRLPTGDLDACLEVTVAHEIGHSLGLFDHTTDTLDLMYSNPVATGLSPRDVRTAEVIYHIPADMVPVRP